LTIRSWSSRSRSSYRGQGLVEFALVLPLILLLLLMAIDFGRVFFGWVGIHNASRIGANYAALHPLADWSNPSDPKRTEYEAQILADAAAINCELPDPLPLPTFPEGTAPGQDAIVTLTCDFEPLIPLVGAIVGDTMQISAEAVFPIRTGIVGMPSGGGGEEEEDDPLCRVVPDLDGMRVDDARLVWEVAGFSGLFVPSIGLDDELVVEDSQVTNPASVPGDCISFSASVSVDTDPAPTCPAGESLLPQITGLLVGQARSRWVDSGFTDTNFAPPSSSGADDEAVTDWTTDPPFDAGDCAPSATTTIGVEHEEAPPPAPCEVPDFIGKKANTAQGMWDAAGFTTTVQFGQAGNFNIGKQSINADSDVDCASVIVVDK
jgi:hypothetical protein